VMVEEKTCSSRFKREPPERIRSASFIVAGVRLRLNFTEHGKFQEGKHLDVTQTRPQAVQAQDLESAVRCAVAASRRFITVPDIQQQQDPLEDFTSSTTSEFSSRRLESRLCADSEQLVNWSPISGI